eukprot:CAMPEP_0173427388 /NCGR_PEP_ID=MMETSP1357-20121228/6603_1 /TAXON_ID=77926 /ORGANISM="Hemiselmis rufescens, Strain PCC563" /LENGTH=56 /DNA_ID=CAMNT_0014391223 /DNA_START=93 /DNA_END=260 /DNA_ORIENTATION=+
MMDAITPGGSGLSQSSMIPSTVDVLSSIPVEFEGTISSDETLSSSSNAASLNSSSK